jgi:hypothetical protein
MLLRSEAEQLVGQELIKALSDFKQLAVTPLFPQAQQLNSTVKDSNVEHFVDARSCNLYWGIRLKCQKPVVKVVRDILTKK